MKEPKYRLEATLKCPNFHIANNASIACRHFFTKEKGSSKECERKYGASWDVMPEEDKLSLLMLADNKEAVRMDADEWDNLCARMIQKLGNNWFFRHMTPRGTVEQLKVKLKKFELTTFEVVEL